MRSVIEDLSPPRRSDCSATNKDGGGDGQGRHAQESNSTVLVGMRWNEFQVESRQPEEKAYPQKPLPEAQADQEPKDKLAHQRVIPSGRRQVKPTEIPQGPVMDSRHTRSDEGCNISVRNDDDDGFGDERIT